MPMIDVAVTKKGTIYTSRKFTECLEYLEWTRGEGLMNAIELFTGLCNNDVYCPVISRECTKLKMVWEYINFGLVVWLEPFIDELRYATYEQDKVAKIITIDHYEARTLLEYWATFINQDHPKKESTDGASRSEEIA